ncbi:MAG: YcxB family protein [Lachnospiraceae bacterium]|nr:YcxB family protein [Lachnospiraceae bacterium]
MSEEQKELQESPEETVLTEEQTEEVKDAGVEPEGEPLYEVDIQINTSALYDYFLRHVYTSFSGMLGTVIGIFMLMLYFVKESSVIYLICGIVIILYLPWSLYLTAKKQALQETFKNPLHYAFYENGVQVSQGDIKQMQKWEDMLKAVSTTRSIIIYTGKNSASIFPRKDLGGDAMGLIQIISTHMDPKKVKIKE